MQEFRALFQRILAANALLLLLFCITSCGGGTIAGTTTNTDTHPLTAPQVSLTPASLDFGNLSPAAKASRAVSLSNTGQAPLTLLAISSTGDFGQTNDCGSTLAAASACTITITFSPTAVGLRSGTVSITDNATGSPHRVSLSGTGVSAPTPAANVNPTSISFGNQTVNTTSAGKAVTLANTGNAAMSISGITTTGEFAQTNNCGSSVAVGAACTITVTFRPTGVGTKTGTMSVADNAAGTPQQINLTGTGVSAPTPAANVNPTSISFGNQTVNTTSAGKTVAFANTGNAALSISGITSTGDFAQTNNCGSSVAAGAACTITITFRPTGVGPKTGTVNIADSAAGSPQQVNLTGAGVSAPTPAVNLSPGSLSFPGQVVNTTSTRQSVTLSNTGTAALAINSATMTGDFAQTNNCGTSLAAGANCQFTITFTPTATGTRTGKLSVSDNASGSPQGVSLTGTGVAPGQLSVNPASINFGTLVLGDTSTQSIQLSNTGSASVTIMSASTSGPGFSVSGLALPVTLAANQSSSFKVTFAPSNSGNAGGSIQLTTSASSSQTVIALTGNGIAAVAHSVDLVWNPSSSTVIGYNVYRSAQSAGPYTKLNSSLIAGAYFSDSAVVSGQTYWYVVTAVEAGDLESGYSNAVMAVIPTP